MTQQRLPLNLACRPRRNYVQHSMRRLDSGDLDRKNGIDVAGTLQQRLHHQPLAMKAAQVSDYTSYARELIAAVPDRHFSFEVFSDEMRK
jgi:hypothetical protein